MVDGTARGKEMKYFTTVRLSQNNTKVKQRYHNRNSSPSFALVLHASSVCIVLQCLSLLHIHNDDG